MFVVTNSMANAAVEAVLPETLALKSDSQVSSEIGQCRNNDTYHKIGFKSDSRNSKSLH